VLHFRGTLQAGDQKHHFFPDGNLSEDEASPCVRPIILAAFEFVQDRIKTMLLVSITFMASRMCPIDAKIFAVPSQKRLKGKFINHEHKNLDSDQKHSCCPDFFLLNAK
jgi:hypothetical protein